jgi:hypothetical protein
VKKRAISPAEQSRDFQQVERFLGVRERQRACCGDIIIPDVIPAIWGPYASCLGPAGCHICSLAAPRKIYKIPSENALFVFHNCMQAAPLRLLLACRLSLCCCRVRGESRNRSPHTVFCSGVHLSLKFLILFAYKKSKLCLMRRPPFHTKNTHILYL